MRPQDVICRLCRKPYDWPEGCATCQPAKANIIWPAMQEGSEFTELNDVARQSIRVMRTCLDKLQREIATAPTQAFNSDWSREAGQLGRALASILTEARKLEEREAQEARASSFEDKVKVFLGWVEQLPREYRDKMLHYTQQALLPAPSEAELVE